MEKVEAHDRAARQEPSSSCVSRRRFLLVGGAGSMTVMLGELFPGRVFPQDEDRAVRFAAYPRTKIGQLSALEPGKAVDFLYPDDGPHSISLLRKLGAAAGGGIGPDQDVVAFNSLCPHQGGTLRGICDDQHNVAGPCPIHLSTFDLTRHGIVVAGHATESLPQIVLELEGDDIFAVGIVGLIYGYSNNLAFVKES